MPDDGAANPWLTFSLQLSTFIPHFTYLRRYRLSYMLSSERHLPHRNGPSGRKRPKRL